MRILRVRSLRQRSGEGKARSIHIGLSEKVSHTIAGSIFKLPVLLCFFIG